MHNLGQDRISDDLTGCWNEVSKENWKAASNRRRRRGELLTPHVAARPFLLRDGHFVAHLVGYIFWTYIRLRRLPVRIVIILTVRAGHRNIIILVINTVPLSSPLS